MPYLASYYTGSRLCLRSCTPLLSSSWFFRLSFFYSLHNFKGSVSTSAASIDRNTSCFIDVTNRKYHWRFAKHGFNWDSLRQFLPLKNNLLLINHFLDNLVNKRKKTSTDINSAYIHNKRIFSFKESAERIEASRILYKINGATSSSGMNNFLSRPIITLCRSNGSWYSKSEKNSLHPTR